MNTPSLTIRPAVPDDVDAISRLADVSVSTLLREFLTEAQMAETDDFNVLDPWLIIDRTYSVALIDNRVIASGGWGRRRAHTRGPNASAEGAEALDPLSEPARIRAMYTHPDFARRGLDRAILSVAEAGARLAGFQRAELIASPVGEKLYATCGREVIDRPHITTRSGLNIAVAHMSKQL
ncbi:MAG: GNAT family N-acetyltransferase [Hyphomicrobiales bacterium]|nr:GNAT family N-acetyltransferase [Hyphomicrobiales bacterium]MCP4997220.1 GNAT family N-acetyltransferase [Hyphomicrobiales bacterium]